MIDKFTKEERCLHYIEFHAVAYGAPADNEGLEGIMEKYQGMTSDQTKLLLLELKDKGKIKYSEGRIYEGWALIA